jgi:chromosome segregation ATPase
MTWESTSVAKSRHAVPPELDRLELTVRRLLEAHDAWRARAETAEARIRELERAVQELASGSLDPVAMADEVRSLETQNAELRTRLSSAQQAVQRMLSRLQFVEEER